jgi:hypothetical protein
MHTTRSYQTNTKFIKQRRTDVVFDSTTNKVNNSSRKAGRTLLIKSASGTPLTSSLFESFQGLQSNVETKSTNSFFLTFDTADNAVLALESLKSNSSDYLVKFSYYRVFFTMTGLEDTTDYNQLKKSMTEYVSEHTKTNVLYCKFYRKGDKYLGCGDLTIDSLEGMNTLLSKESGFKDYSFNDYSGSFYRFNSNKDKIQNLSEARL